jgi:hypothetical protein
VECPLRVMLSEGMIDDLMMKEEEDRNTDWGFK